jgi:GTPase Era involved in 16S rRNA processing
MHIIREIVKCTMTKVQGINANGENVIVFMDIVGNISDYPAVTHALDVPGQNSRAACPLFAIF